MPFPAIFGKICASGFECSKQNFIMADHAKGGGGLGGRGERDRSHRSPSG